MPRAADKLHFLDDLRLELCVKGMGPVRSSELFWEVNECKNLVVAEALLDGLLIGNAESGMAREGLDGSC